jgi:tRNA pseudouridine38-40 synthase
VFEASWTGNGPWLVFRISANGFLNRMVRSLVGSMKAVGEGSWSTADFKAALASRDRGRSAQTAPAHGLFLHSVTYE